MWLLLIIPLSIVIPQLSFFSIELDQPIINNIYAYGEIEQVETSDTVLPNETHMNPISYSYWVMTVYLSISFFLLIRLVFQIIQLFQLKSRYSFNKKSNINYVRLPEADIPFSFFNNIFIPQSYFSNEKYQPVVEHEKEHVNQKHSFDLIAMEVFCSFMWFNPFVIFYRKEMKMVHEFQVDSKMLKKEISIQHYVDLLMENVWQVKSLSAVNGFKSSTLKDRIVMMTKNESNSYLRISYLALIPMVLVLLFSFSIKNNTTGTIPSIKPISESEEYKITSGYGYKASPITGEKKLHTGVDFKASIGTPVIATGNGKVVKAEFNKEGYGKMIVIQHTNQVNTVYGHLSSIDVEVGDVVRQSQRIGKVGNTGRSTGPHLHYEVIVDGQKVNPELYFKKQ